MLPHQAMLGLPPLKKHRRRTIPFGKQLHNVNCPHYDRQCKPQPTLDEVYIRELNITDAGLGCAIWDGSIILARWLHKDAKQIFNNNHDSSVNSLSSINQYSEAQLQEQSQQKEQKEQQQQECNVLELGCGVALPSITASRYVSATSRVWCSDYMNEILRNAQYNIKINSTTQSEIDDVIQQTEFSELTTQQQDCNCISTHERIDALKRRLNSATSARTVLHDWHDFQDLPHYSHCGASEWDQLRANSATANTTKDELDERQNCDADDERQIDSDFESIPAESIHLLIGAEIMYTCSLQHRTSLARCVNYHLKPGGRMLLVQSTNREGMSLFCERMQQQYGYSLSVTPLASDDELVQQLQERPPKRGEFTQRTETYQQFEFVKPLQPPSVDQIRQSIIQSQLQQNTSAIADDCMLRHV